MLNITNLALLPDYYYQASHRSNYFRIALSKQWKTHHEQLLIPVTTQEDITSASKQRQEILTALGTADDDCCSPKLQLILKLYHDLLNELAKLSSSVISQVMSSTHITNIKTLLTHCDEVLATPNQVNRQHALTQLRSTVNSLKASCGAVLEPILGNFLEQESDSYLKETIDPYSFAQYIVDGNIIEISDFNNLIITDPEIVKVTKLVTQSLLFDHTAKTLDETNTQQRPNLFSSNFTATVWMLADSDPNLTFLKTSCLPILKEHTLDLLRIQKFESVLNLWQSYTLTAQQFLKILPPPGAWPKLFIHSGELLKVVWDTIKNEAERQLVTDEEFIGPLTNFQAMPHEAAYLHTLHTQIMAIFESKKLLQRHQHSLSDDLTHLSESKLSSNQKKMVRRIMEVELEKSRSREDNTFTDILSLLKLHPVSASQLKAIMPPLDQWPRYFSEIEADTLITYIYENYAKNDAEIKTAYIAILSRKVEKHMLSRDAYSSARLKEILPPLHQWPDYFSKYDSEVLITWIAENFKHEQDIQEACLSTKDQRQDMERINFAKKLDTILLEDNDKASKLKAILPALTEWPNQFSTFHMEDFVIKLWANFADDDDIKAACLATFKNKIKQQIASGRPCDLLSLLNKSDKCGRSFSAEEIKEIFPPREDWPQNFLQTHALIKYLWANYSTNDADIQKSCYTTIATKIINLTDENRSDKIKFLLDFIGVTSSDFKNLIKNEALQRPAHEMVILIQQLAAPELYTLDTDNTVDNSLITTNYEEQLTQEYINKLLETHQWETLNELAKYDLLITQNNITVIIAMYLKKYADDSTYWEWINEALTELATSDCIDQTFLCYYIDKTVLEVATADKLLHHGSPLLETLGIDKEVTDKAIKDLENALASHDYEACYQAFKITNLHFEARKLISDHFLEIVSLETLDPIINLEDFREKLKKTYEQRNALKKLDFFTYLEGNYPDIITLIEAFECNAHVWEKLIEASSTLSDQVGKPCRSIFLHDFVNHETLAENDYWFIPQVIIDKISNDIAQTPYIDTPHYSSFRGADEQLGKDAHRLAFKMCDNVYELQPTPQSNLVLLLTGQAPLSPMRVDTPPRQKTSSSPISLMSVSTATPQPSPALQPQLSFFSAAPCPSTPETILPTEERPFSTTNTFDPKSVNSQIKLLKFWIELARESVINHGDIKNYITNENFQTRLVKPIVNKTGLEKCYTLSFDALAQTADDKNWRIEIRALTDAAIAPLIGYNQKTDPKGKQRDIKFAEAVNVIINLNALLVTADHQAPTITALWLQLIINTYCALIPKQSTSYYKTMAAYKKQLEQAFDTGELKQILQAGVAHDDITQAQTIVKNALPVQGQRHGIIDIDNKQTFPSSIKAILVQYSRDLTRTEKFKLREKLGQEGYHPNDKHRRRSTSQLFPSVLSANGNTHASIAVSSCTQ